jgi:AhpD family alkylhydroperoxidase
MEALFKLPTDDQLSETALSRLRELPPLNYYRMTALVDKPFIPMTDLIRAVVSDIDMEPRFREIATLRYAHVSQCAYMWHSHALLARNNGVTEKEIDAITADPTVIGLDADGNMICQAVDELYADRMISEKTRSKLKAQHTDGFLAELVMCIGLYAMVAMIIDGMGVQKEEDEPLANATKPV